MTFRVDGVSPSYSQWQRNCYCDHRMKKITVAVPVVCKSRLALYWVALLAICFWVDYVAAAPLPCVQWSRQHAKYSHTISLK